MVRIQGVVLLLSFASSGFLFAQAPAASPVPCTPSVAAASVERPLTNDDVLALVAAKLPEALVVEKIAGAPAEALDVSADTLVTLSAKRVPATVLDAMLKRVELRKTGAPVVPAKSEPSFAERMRAKLQRGGKTGETSAAGAVTIYWKGAPAEKYKELGRVEAGKYNFAGISRSREAIEAELKKKAGELGADAVVTVTEDFASVTGTAVKLEKP